MSSLASSPAALTLSIAVGGLIASGGCALVYHFDDYTGESGASGASVSAAGSGGSGGGGSVSASAGSGESTGSGGGGGLSAPVWARSFGTKGVDVSGHAGVAVSNASMHNVTYVIGQFQGPVDVGTGTLTPKDDGIVLAQLDSATGKTNWSRLIASVTSNQLPHVPAIATTADGSVMVAANFDVEAYPNDAQMPKASAGATDFTLFLISPENKIIRADTFGDSQNQVIHAVAFDGTGNMYITGAFSGELNLGATCDLKAASMNGATDGFVAVLDATGLCIWAVPWTSPNTTAGEAGLSLAPVTDGVFLGGTYTISTTIGGQTIMGSINNETFVAKLSLVASNASFVIPITGGRDVALATNQHGGAHVGATVNMGAPNSNFIVGNIDGSMGFSAMSSYSAAGSARLRSIASTPSDAPFITGWSDGPLVIGQPLESNGAEDVFLAKLSPSFSPLNALSWGDKGSQFGQTVAVDLKQGVYLGGEFMGILDFGKFTLVSSGGTDVFVAKFDPTSFAP